MAGSLREYHSTVNIFDKAINIQGVLIATGQTASRGKTGVHISLV